MDNDLDVGRGPQAWSIARLIALIDEAIDSAGDQLARSGGLGFEWTEVDAAVRPIGGRRPRRPSLASACEYEAAAAPGPELP
ncbi:hypothetical protein ACIA49_33160 [Kribbella sp. NPDC051587]|uniref:hypothetical protein n=1 Tax=Kribbella sp. NPDC051587 TaxID=3364119 RepID=UPI0037B9F927